VTWCFCVLRLTLFMFVRESNRRFSQDKIACHAFPAMCNMSPFTRIFLPASASSLLFCAQGSGSNSQAGTRPAPVASITRTQRQPLALNVNHSHPTSITRTQRQSLAPNVNHTHPTSITRTQRQSLALNVNHSHPTSITRTQRQSLAPNVNHSHPTSITRTQRQSLAPNVNHSHPTSITRTQHAAVHSISGDCAAV
jgi:uncharacterized protein YejL (UPF0352 family)